MLSSLRHPQDRQSDAALPAPGAWASSGWPARRSTGRGFHAGERRRRLPLPTYPFERQRYWVEPRRQTFEDAQRRAALRKRPDVADWLYVPSWRQTAAAPAARSRPPPPGCCSSTATALGERLAERLREMGQRVTVTVGDLRERR